MADQDDADKASKEAVGMTESIQHLLAQTFGGPVILSEVKSLRRTYRNHVMRCSIAEASAGLPASVIVKAAVGEGEAAYDPADDTTHSTAWRLTNDWAGNLFLNRVGEGQPPLNARLLCGDRAQGLFVLEDLGEGSSLADALQGESAEEAEAGLIAYARALGGLHARTVGHRDTWREVRLGVGGGTRERESQGAHWIEKGVVPFRERCAELGVPLASGFDGEVEEVRRAMDEPGPFEAFTPEDACPDNHRLMPDGSVRFFDFEWAGYRHALLDAAYVHVPFPTCWCVNRIPAGLPARLEEIYRVELASACPAAQDDAAFYQAMSYACAFWTIRTLNELKENLAEDGPWGLASMRQRHLYRLEMLAETTSRFGHLPALTEAANALAARLAALWLPGLEPMPLYPAFRGSAR